MIMVFRKYGFINLIMKFIENWFNFVIILDFVKIIKDISGLGLNIIICIWFLIVEFRSWNLI